MVERTWPGKSGRQVRQARRGPGGWTGRLRVVILAAGTNMDLVISYTSADREKLRPLLDGLHRLRYQAWFDQELSGGQEWWDAILGRIRACDALILAVSPAVIDSEACAREVSYARAVGKPILPVMIEAVRPELLPSHLASVQIVDFTDPAGKAAFDLTGALLQLPAPLPLPNPLPAEPPVPISYLSDLSERIQVANLTLDEQLSLVGRLRQGLAKPRERDAVLELVRRLKQRDDLYYATAQELDLMTAPAVAKAPASSEAAQAPPGVTPASGSPALAAPAVPAPGPYAAMPPAYVQPSPPVGAYGQYAPPGTNWRQAPVQKSNRGLLIAGGIVAALLILVGTGAAIAYVASNNNPTPAPAVGDRCVVGTWVLQNAAAHSSSANGSATMSGGDGAVLTITEDGKFLLDFANSKPLIVVASNGRQGSAQLQGTFTARVHAGPNGAWSQTQLSTTVMETDVINGQSQPTKAAQILPDQSYNCTSSQLVLISQGETDTFSKS